jgi:hypothetical protein
MLHLVFGLEKHAEGWDLFCELASQICDEQWPENVAGVMLTRPMKLCPAIEWRANIHLLASEMSLLPLNRATWMQWTDRNGTQRSHCLPTSGSAIDDALKGLGVIDEVQYRVPFDEFEHGIFRASSEAIELLLTHGAADGPCGIDGFRYANNEKHGLARKPFALVKYLWNRPDRTARFSDLALPVNGDREDDIDEVAVGSWQRSSNSHRGNRAHKA